jgi:hypothetical protein
MGAPPSVSQQLTTLPVLPKHSAVHRFGQYLVTQRVGFLRRILGSMRVTAHQVRRQGVGKVVLRMLRGGRRTGVSG